MRKLLTLLTGAMWMMSAPAHAAVSLVPMASGLSSPVFVTHAGDRSGRLFIVEQPGYIRVLSPGASASIFLDIHGKVRFDGEEGLLGLAFHPQYASNGRFFVYYVRGDQSLVIAQYAVSADRNVADAGSERVLLTIPHPNFTNHNGGMLTFGDDGYLYVGVGDGGSANDPPGNAQNLNALLGKILRIDVDRSSGSDPYASPPTNPFYGAIPGRDEIFAYGLRNPWRFSFDRARGQLWVADVGQGAREEVNTPIVSGGNYGWRVYEGNSCTNTDRGLCTPGNYLFPIFDYDHGGGRCSITGGYVYRGARGTLPAGAYVYGDYCSGEIFTWNGQQQAPLMKTSANISSFGEDESGELYVVDLRGTVSRLVGDTPCEAKLIANGRFYRQGGGTGVVEATSTAGCDVAAVSNASWIHIVHQQQTTPTSYSATVTVEPNEDAKSRQGTISISGATYVVQQGGATQTRANP